MNYPKKLIVYFIFLCFGYALWVSLFSTPVHLDVDEELYLGLARSFHYDGSFHYNGTVLNYSCILYSMLISLAYYFYTPNSILFMMRFIGVICICSFVFPSFLLAREILQNEKKAFWLTFFLGFMPYMADSAYLMQEVLSYPLFLWTVYFAYLMFLKNTRFVMPTIFSAVFSIFCIFTKTYLFFIPLILNFYGITHASIKAERKSTFKKLAIYDSIYLFFYFVGKLIIWKINHFETGSNHYSAQFSNLFPIGFSTLFYGLLGCLFYFVFFTINVGILPMWNLLKSFKTSKGKDFIVFFSTISIFFLIFETVFMIFLTEEGTGTLPHKFLFRYFQIFVPLLIILYVKSDIKLDSILRKKLVFFSISVVLPASLYCFIMKGNTHQAIMDGHFFLLLENITKHLFPYADAFILIFLLITAIAVLLYTQKGNGRLKSANSLLVLSVCLLLIINFIQLPYYSNQIEEGNIIQADSILLANYLNENHCERLYYVYQTDEEKTNNARNFYGYVIQSYEVISADQFNQICSRSEISKNNLYFIAPTTYIPKNESLEEINLSSQNINVYYFE